MSELPNTWDEMGKFQKCYLFGGKNALCDAK